MTRCPPRVRCRGVVPAVSHIMLHSDTLANEFNEILNAVEIFAPFQPLDPAVTFYAPLRNNVRDLRLNPDDFQRSSDAWYKDNSGIYRNVGINRPRFEQSRLLMEPAKTNKSENYNANPDAGLTGIGGTGTPTIVSRPDLIASSGLSELCPDGNVLELDNSAGGAAVNITFEGIAGNTNHHTFSCWARRTKQIGIGNEVRLEISSIAGNVAVNTEWRRYEMRTVDHGPPSSASIPRIAVDPGFGLEVILNQFEESPVASSPIVTEGTAGQRAVETLRWENVATWFNQSEGMSIVTFSMPFDYINPGASRPILTTYEGSNSISCLRPTANQEFFINDTTTLLSVAPGDGNQSADSLCVVASRWVGSEMQIGVHTAGFGWNWSPVAPYDGDFTIDTHLTALRLFVLPAHIRDAFIYNEDRGVAWIEANH